jgi:tetratricopeptide (TPR) repeat protein
MYVVRICTFCVLACAILFIGCSGSINEVQYAERADEVYKSGLFKEAKLYYKNLLMKFPDSPDVKIYKERLGDVLIKLALSANSEIEAETYIREIEMFELSANDTVISFFKYRRAIQLTDNERDIKLSELTYEQFLLAAQYNLNRGKFKEALEIYENLIVRMPNHLNLDKALFLAGFISSEYLKDTQKARGYFQRLVNAFPESDLADDGKWMLENMGKPLEQVTFIPELEKHQSK